VNSIQLPNKFALIKFAYSAALLWMLAFTSACTDTGRTPDDAARNQTTATNLLIIVADDLGHNDLAITNSNDQIHTPNLDKLARQGVRFSRHYASPVCSPARAALLTGLHPERLGFLPNGRGIPSEVTTLPEHLIEHGFSTWHFGKWHMGDEIEQARPNHQGFKYWLGFLNQWRLPGTTSDGVIKLGMPRYNNPYLQGSEQPGKFYEGHLEDILTSESMSRLSKLADSQEPWFLHLAYFAPHEPIEPAKRFSKLYPDTNEGRYKALVHQLDDNVGRLLQHLEQLEILEKTIVVFVSDNGGTAKHYKASNEPFYGRKSTLTEGGLRSPLIIRWPEKSLQGLVVDSQVSIIDLFPTLSRSLGIEPPSGLDGISHYDTLAEGRPVLSRALFWDDGAATRSYGVLSADGRWRLYQPLPFYGAVIDSQLWDLDNDKTASVNVENPEISDALFAQYRNWYMDVHTITTTLEKRNDRTYLLTGSDMLRTPGFGGYTFGTTTTPFREKLIAQQEGVWSLKQSSDKITAKVGEVTLTGTINPSDGCQSLVLSARFDKKSARWGANSSYKIALYINGEKHAEQTVAGTLTIDNISEPTLIGNSDASATPIKPILLNTMLTDTTPINIREFSESLCESKPTALAGT